jgi:hypothetical protein
VATARCPIRGKSASQFDYVDTQIYCTNGNNSQRIFFDEICFANALAEARPE